MDRPVNKEELKATAVLTAFMAVMSAHVVQNQPLPVEVLRELLEQGRAVMHQHGDIQQNIRRLATYLREYSGQVKGQILAKSSNDPQK